MRGEAGGVEGVGEGGCGRESCMEVGELKEPEGFREREAEGRGVSGKVLGEGSRQVVHGTGSSSVTIRGVGPWVSQ